ncbi:MAG: T9SS type A sorting domain-containing protein [candidate division Zixibacteria bacterium]
MDGYVPEPSPAENGGPDSYGYNWIDNDDAGGPEFYWIDISRIGVPVTGLMDDNIVGPFGMGFEFPYYWYTVNHCWIGSNGYISFSSDFNFMYPFSGIPNSDDPNDLIAVLTGDLNPSRGEPECYYYTNNADSFIVSWINFGEFNNIDSTHSFQVIFSAADSSILFQYGENHGSFRDGVGNHRTLIGIENANGQVGIEYMHDNIPENHLWHDGLAVKFHPEPDPTFEAFDFEIVDGLREGSGAGFMPNNQPYSVSALAKNSGNRTIDNVDVRCQIRRESNTVYDEITTIGHLEPGQEIWVYFDSPFTPIQVADYQAAFTAIMFGDQNPNNDTRVCELVSYELPQELRYCDDTAEGGRAWSGDYSGFGVEFQMPEGIEVTGSSFHVFSVTMPGPAYVLVLPDNGGPDENNPLAGDTITVTSAGWKDIDFGSAGLTFDPEEKFYMVVLHAFESTFSFSMDQSTPLSYRGWEYTGGGLAPDRDREICDVMFRINANGVTGIENEIIPISFTLDQNYPNPFNAATNIRFVIDRESDVRIDIFNTIGQSVSKLSGRFQPGENMVTWDASDIASGVYFYRISVDDNAETRKMTLVK